MTPWKLGLGLNTGRRIDEDMMTSIGRTDIVGITGRMMTVVMTIVGLIVIIPQEMIGGHTRVTDTMIIDDEMMTGEMMIIVDTMKIEDLKEPDNFKTRIGTI